nr:immunoglobulin heavy chain junction region [Macaca mulatta]MPN69475.1 immunoglobulin heavy chain junction region [Macaca mulatta]MPN69918.1 immunoglobulin heavy chain junction region [Macaca mulatta]MPN70129.1 immunoglobulin heavy chain junction region [Macaca mulatta]MPN70201.1 immunoglobulin heavy chain junction region [Macaca mulatta]
CARETWIQMQLRGFEYW